jgi:formate hydrogenlyase subunit 3/multisubunit Na+/H+ antiporter MnhD subunit
VIAGVFTAALLSLAGIPATMGFLGKFYVLAAGAAAAAWPLIIILVVTSVAGLFYYLRIVVALYSAPPERAPIQMVSRGGAFILVVLMILLIWFGVYPAPLLNLIRTTTAALNVVASSITQPEKGFPALAPHFRLISFPLCSNRIHPPSSSLTSRCTALNPSSLFTLQ